MLAKLLKNEFIQTGRMYLWLLGIGIVGGGLGALATMKPGSAEISLAQFFVGFLWNFLLILAASVLQTVGLIVTLVSTNRSLFSERGYLTLSLPVSTTELLLSKFVANVSFMLLNIAEAVALVYVAITNMIRLFKNAGDTLINNYGMQDFGDMFTAESLGLPSTGEWVRVGANALVVVFMFLVLAMTVALFVLTVSHVRPFQSATGFWIPAFIVACSLFCYFAVKQISDLLKLSVPLRFGGVFGDEVMKLNMTTAIVMVGLSIGFFFLTNWLMRRKISLK
ncbi:MAG: hypothetical protein FWH26_11360 [Oscillospiraceae bacterium]|nr:hypothetical protein [Oscillospiraceae bacterium]